MAGAIVNDDVQFVDDAAEADVIVCSRAGDMPLPAGSLPGDCAACGCAIVTEPNLPPAVPTVCLPCAFALAGGTTKQ